VHRSSGRALRGLLALVGVLGATLAIAVATAAATSPGLVCFSSNRTGSYQVYTMNSDGSDLRQLTSTSAYNDRYGDHSPDLSPDGDSIVYLHKPGLGGRLFVMRADGSGAHPITRPGASGEDPQFSPDGGKIVFDAGTTIYTVNADGTHRHKVIALHGGTAVYGPTFSPDGQWLAFAWERRYKRTSRIQIYEVRVDGSHLRRLTAGPGNPQDADFSPDGSEIAFVKGIGANARQSPQIYTMDPTTKAQRKLTSNPHGALDPAFSPDGSEIVYAANQYGAWTSDRASYALRVMKLDGTSDLPLTAPLRGIISMSWRP